MSVYGKLVGALMSVAIIGGGAAYVMTAGREVMAEANSLSEEFGCYILREYEGNIALFRENEETPVAVYRIPVGGINAADHELLREGIRLRSLSEVLRLLEDLDIEQAE